MPVPIKPLAFTAEEINALTDQWSDLEIAAQHRLAYSAVRKARLAHGVKTFTQKTGLVRIAETGELRRKGSVRGAVRTDGLQDDYFACIDNPEKAYWIGLLMADGWVTLREGVPKEVGLACHPQDDELLTFFGKAIGSSGRIVTKTNNRSYSSSGKSQISTIRITCQAFTRHAIAAGVKTRKSGCLVLPPAAHLFPSDFCRGFFDGDGSICHRSFTFICGSADFQQELMALIRYETGHALHPAIVISPNNGKGVERLSGYRKDKSVLDWMYQRNSPALSRKYLKYITHWS